jgi:hypothetical protein
VKSVLATTRPLIYHFEPCISEIAGNGLGIILKVFSHLEHNVEISILAYEAYQATSITHLKTQARRITIGELLK